VDGSSATKRRKEGTKMNSTDAVGQPGVASGTLVRNITSTSDGKQTRVEKLSNRHYVTAFDFDQGRWHEKRVKQRIEHTGQRILVLGYKKYGSIIVLLVSEWQEIWAADGRDEPARWIKAKDLVAERHFLKVADAKKPWAKLVMAEPPKFAEYRDLSVHELVLVDSDSYIAGDVVCRTRSAPPPPPVKKRLFYPLKDFPLINFVPQPKTLTLAYAEVWYRKSAALLPRCIDESLEPMARLQAALELKQRMREVAAKSAMDTSLRGEFIAEHPLPTLEDLVPDHAQLAPETLKQAVETAIQTLSAPGERRYSEFTGGMESHYVWAARDEYWKFDGNQWIRSSEK
jgi:hypothetical protein